MAKRGLRKITVEGEHYLWRVTHLYDAREGTLRVYSAEHKAGWLEVHFTYQQLNDTFKDSAIYRWTGEKSLPLIVEPILIVRIIRYARKQMEWSPDKNTAPLIFDNGYALLKQIGYEPIWYSK